jgi:hypothetical protein
MSAFRCSICGISWPAKREFDKCQKCLESTDGVNNIDPDMTLAEAQSMAHGFQFERFYEGHKADLELKPDELKFTLEAWKAEADERRRQQAQKDLGTTRTALPANSGIAT